MGRNESCEALLRQIALEAREVAAWSGRDSFSSRVLAAMRAVRRECFVPPAEEPYAYANVPLPIGHGQTISQPFVVAFMTDMLDVGADDVVLEIGTGSGYQAAVLSRLVRRVYSIEIIPELAAAAAERLARLGFDNVEVRDGDGYHGWIEHAPFDGVIVTAAAPEIPPPLVEQLRGGRRLIIPVEESWSQNLILIEKDAAGGVHRRYVLPVAFVPLTRRVRSS